MATLEIIHELDAPAEYGGTLDWRTYALAEHLARAISLGIEPEIERIIDGTWTLEYRGARFESGFTMREAKAAIARAEYWNGLR